MRGTGTNNGGIYSHLGADPDLGDLVTLFVQEIPQRLNCIQRCWENRDWTGLGHAAHQLKGAAGSYGFAELTPTLQRLEDAARRHLPDDEISRLMQQLVELCTCVRPGVPA